MKTYKQNGWDVPDGHVIVPSKPTAHMLVAGASAIEGFETTVNVVNAGRSYKQMIAAASQPPAKPEVGAEPVALAGTMPGSAGFTMAVFKAADIPVDTPLYTAPPDTQAIRDAALEEAVDACRVFAKSLEYSGCEYEASFAGGFVDAIRERKGGAA